jgi:methionyl-tRNA formyltransferase
MKKIGIIGSRDLACKILEWIVNDDNVEVVGVVAPPFKGWWIDNLRETSIRLNLHVFDNLNDLISTRPEVIFSINYWKIIDEDTIKKIPGGIINIHHSYLLKYRGRYSTSWAIINARKLNCWYHGTTLHYITKDLDAGPIIASYKCEILEIDTAEILFERVEKLAIKMFIENFQKIINSQIENYLEPDSNFIYYDIDSKNEIEINYGTPIAEVYDIIRAWSFKDRPKPYFLFNNHKILLSLTE